MVYIGMELTKKHEQHFRDTVERVMEQLVDQNDGQRIKGEITMVLAPWKEDDEYIKLTRGYQFDPEKDGRLNCNVLDIAKKLD